MSTLIVMVGIAGAGKSTVAKHIAETHGDCVIVSRDSIRFAIMDNDPGADYFKHEREVEKNYYDAISAYLKTHDYVIADATHVNKKSRRKLFNNIAVSSGTNVVAVFVDTPYGVAVGYNKLRQGREQVPEKAINNMYNHLEEPVEDEGFDKVYVLSRVNGDILKVYHELEEI